MNSETLNRFIVNLSMDNAAFTELGAETEVARILRKIADTIERDGFSGFFETIYDVNGNDVGRFAAKPASYFINS